MTSPSISLLLRARVELLAELHDVDLRLTQSGSNRGAGVALAANNLAASRSPLIFFGGAF